MSKKKAPFHEVVARKLANLLVSINRTPTYVKESGLLMLLAILEESEMPVRAAHQIAKDNADLPALLKRVSGSIYVIDASREMLSDLAHREDETPTPAPSLTPEPLKPEDTGFHRE